LGRTPRAQSAIGDSLEKQTRTVGRVHPHIEVKARQHTRARGIVMLSIHQPPQKQ
jgi:hypothetical protein